MIGFGGFLLAAAAALGVVGVIDMATASGWLVARFPLTPDQAQTVQAFVSSTTAALIVGAAGAMVRGIGQVRDLLAQLLEYAKADPDEVRPERQGSVDHHDAPVLPIPPSFPS